MEKENKSIGNPLNMLKKNRLGNLKHNIFLAPGIFLQFWEGALVPFTFGKVAW